ncbi:MAG TPA: hypothetical protein VFH99_02040 [Candidatus Saccharimonadales bacterium]|nr:hypothetical protein [Candidatus Saccharimonadales bacterium]
MENSPSVSNKETIEEQAHRSVAPEANQLHGKNLPPERIGHVLVSADIESAKLPAMSKPEAVAAVHDPGYRAATMGRQELLELSEEISIDNTTLRHIYDTHLIGENGLRRLVYEHTHGGNVKEALHHEILEHETDFERDPELRHQLLRRDQEPASFKLGDLLTRAGISEADGSVQPLNTKLPAAHRAKRLQLQARQRRLLDIVSISIILILLILVILLAMSRR